MKKDEIKDVAPLEYDYISCFTGGFPEGFAPVELNGKWGFINEEGEEAITLKYDNTSCFSKGFAGVQLNGKWGFINQKGKEITPIKYNDIYNFPDGFTQVKLNDK